MSQHDFVIDNQSGLLFRQDLNLALVAMASKSSGTAEPTTTYAFQWWVDSSGANPILKYRNAANSAWVQVGRADLESFGLQGIFASDGEPGSPLAFQYWIDTTGSTAILKIRNEANSAWVTVGRADLANYGLLPLTGGSMSGGITFSNTDSITIPVGTTAQRPGSPSTGMMRYNTDLSGFEGYANSVWSGIGGGGYVVTAIQSLSAGGTISSSTVNQRQMRHVQGNAAAITTLATPFGATGGWKDGTEILLIGNANDNTVSIAYNDSAKGIVGNFDVIEIGNGKLVECVYSVSLDRWLVKGNY